MMGNRTVISGLAALSVWLAGTAIGEAAERVWSNPASGDWNEPANWGGAALGEGTQEALVQITRRDDSGKMERSVRSAGLDHAKERHTCPDERTQAVAQVRAANDRVGRQLQHLAHEAQERTNDLFLDVLRGPSATLSEGGCRPTRVKITNGNPPPFRASVLRCQGAMV